MQVQIEGGAGRKGLKVPGSGEAKWVVVESTALEPKRAMIEQVSQGERRTRPGDVGGGRGVLLLARR